MRTSLARENASKEFFVRTISQRSPPDDGRKPAFGVGGAVHGVFGGADGLAEAGRGEEGVRAVVPHDGEAPCLCLCHKQVHCAI